ncbi:MAG: hypothetical protein J5J06_09875 [Phycisphaerae bacterium]|nr:hypothetical protein [Phycisphaerae bacterium]
MATSFGLDLHAPPTVVVADLDIALERGAIVLVLGPSGSGKSTVLAELERRFTAACSVQRVAFPVTSSVIDAVASDRPLSEALSLLTACGCCEPRLWIRRFDELSEGEKFRARLARALGLLREPTPAAPLLCDEFGSLLHRRLARAIAFNLRKLVSARGFSVVLAASNDDLVGDLRPDVIVRLGGQGRVASQHCRHRGTHVFGLRRRLRVEPGSRRDYDDFAAMHYRSADELGFVDKVYVLREGAAGDLLGIVVYAHSPLELSKRNTATQGRYIRDSEAVNRDFRILRRLVIHPDVRGCGLGHFLVRKTLPLVGTRYVECLAGMGAFNPVYEKAGMVRVGQYELPPKTSAATLALRKLGVDPFSRSFAVEVARRRDVRAVVAGVVRDWYAGTTGGGESRVERQSPEFLARAFRGLIGSRPVYYLWEQ